MLYRVRRCTMNHVWLLALLLPGLACAGLSELEPDAATATVTVAAAAATETASPPITSSPTSDPTLTALPVGPPVAQMPVATVTFFWAPLDGGRTPTDEISGSGNFQLGRAVLSRAGVLFMLGGDSRIFSYAFGGGGMADDTLFASGADFSDIALGPNDTLYAVSRLASEITLFDGGGAISETISLATGTAPVVAAPRQRLLTVPAVDHIFVLDVPDPEVDQALLLRRFNRLGELVSWTNQMPLIIGARGLAHDEAGHLYLLPAIGPNVARFDEDGTPAGQIRVNLPDGAGVCALSTGGGDMLFLVTATPHGVLRLSANGQIIDFLNLAETLPIDLAWPDQQRCLVRGIAVSADGQSVYLTLFPSRWPRAIDHVIGFHYD